MAVFKLEFRACSRVAVALCLAVLASSSPASAAAQRHQARAATGETTRGTADVLARVRPAVVTVICTNAKGDEDSQGSGCILATNGVVLTAWHVVTGQAKVRVRLANGASYPAEGLVGWDASKDFALLKVAATKLPTATLGDSDTVRQGDRVHPGRTPRLGADRLRGHRERRSPTT